MGLEDFEKELQQKRLEDQEKDSRRAHHRSRTTDKDEDRRRRHHHRHDDHSHRHRHRSREDIDRHKRDSRHHERHRNGEEPRHDERHRRKRQRTDSPHLEKTKESRVDRTGRKQRYEEDEWVEKAPSTVDKMSDVQRDAWMQEPSATDIDYVRSRRPKTPPGQFVAARQSNTFENIQKDKVDYAAELQRDLESDDEGQGDDNIADSASARHDVSYTFGDAGSSWRMTKLKAVYRQAEESRRQVDEIAMDRYGNLKDFDDAREEERELERRSMYGKEYVGLEKPSGELYQDRKMEAGIRRPHETEAPDLSDDHSVQGQQIEQHIAPSITAPLDSTALNRLKAQMMKAKLRKVSNAAQLEAEYNIAADAALANRAQPDVIVLNRMENRQLAGNREGEVTHLTNKRGRERGTVEENEDMSIEDMVRQEKRSRGTFGGEGRAFAERIAKDTKFTNDLDYMDENASKLGKSLVKSEINLRNTAISDFHRMQKALDNCPLCHHEDSDHPPVAPVVSLATRTYLTLPTEPEIAQGGAVIVPIQHRRNLLECDDDEWEEIRNFMKSLTRYYHAQNRSVIFYENAAFSGSSSSRRSHAALNAIPLPHHLAENGLAYFKEAILSSDEQWSQHRPVIDTLALSQRPGYGKLAFRRAIPKEMPYFHVFFTLDGGLGHVIEDERRWPKGDLFAREVLGGMLDREPQVIKKQGRWQRGDRRVDGFRKKWSTYDWTSALMETQ